jgi:hypothetical protein
MTISKQIKQEIQSLPDDSGAAKGVITIPDSFFEPLPDDLLVLYLGQDNHETSAAGDCRKPHPCNGA